MFQGCLKIKKIEDLVFFINALCKVNDNILCVLDYNEIQLVDLKEKKLMLTEDYPYQATKGECKYDESKGIGKVKSYKKITSQDEDEMKVALYEKGPLSAALFSFPLMFYSGGIYDPLFSFLCPDSVDHAVTIVGYGEEDNTPYWLVKNSWGEDWGEKGYFRIKMGICAIDAATYGGVPIL